MASPKLTTLQSKKRTQKLLLLLTIVTVLGAAFLLLNSKKAQEIGPAESILDSRADQIVQQAASDAFIPQEFFEKDILGNFKPYTPITIPVSWGRDNPFKSYVEPQTELGESQ